MPAPATAQIVEEIGQAVRAGTVEARGVSGVIDIVPRLAARSAVAAAEEFAGEAAGAEVLGAASAAADGLFILCVLAVVLALVALCYIGLFLLLAIARAVTPIPWVGHKIAGLIVNISRPFVDAATALSDILSSNLAKAMGGFIAAVHWAVSQIPQGVRDPIKAIVDLEIQGWVRQLQELQTVVYGLLGTQPDSSSQTGGVPSGVTGQLAQLKVELSEAQTRNDRQGQEIGQLNRRVGTLENQVEVLAHQVEGLRVSIYGARASTLGVQDLVHQVDELRQTVSAEQATQRAQIQHNTQAVDALAPLTTLMYLGERGLANLRNLEENPCQCPSLPNIGSLAPDVISLYEFITNG